VYNIALRITSDPDAASDCAQEAFIRAYKALHQYDPSLPFGPWIFRIATNASLNHVQRWHAHQTVVDELPESVVCLVERLEPDSLRRILDLDPRRGDRRPSGHVQRQHRPGI